MGERMTDIATIGVRMTTDGLDRGVKSLDDLAARGPKVERAMHGVETSATSASQAVRSFAATALAGASLAGLVGKLVSVQREFDVLNSSLVTVARSSAAAEREMAWLKQFAAETPYGLAQATQAFVRMKSLGLDPTRESLTSFGNTASAMGKTLMQFVEAVADASTSEFERLKEFGIKAKQEGDKVSLTFQGVTQTIGNNAGEIVKYLTRIGNTDFSGAMALRAKTLDGAIATLGDSWDELFRSVNEVTGMSRGMKATVDEAASAIDGLGSTLRENREIIDSVMSGLAGAGAAAGLLALPTAIRAVSGALAALAVVAAANPVALAVLGIGAAVGVGVSAARTYANSEGGIREAIKSLEEQNTRSEEAFARAMGAGRTKGADTIRQTIDGRKEEIRSLRKELEDVIRGPGKQLSANDFGLTLPKFDYASPAKVDKEAIAAAKKSAEDRMRAQIEGYRNMDKAILDNRQDFYTQLGYQIELGEKNNLQAIGEGMDREFVVWQERAALLYKELDLLKTKKDSQKDQADVLGRLADLERDYNRAGMKAAGDVAVSVRNTARAYEEARIAAEGYINTIRRQSERGLSAMGKGALAGERAGLTNQREDQYQGRVDQVRSQYRAGDFGTGDEAKKRLDSYLEMERSTLAEVLRIDDETWAQRMAKQADWSLGASEALHNYASESANVYRQTESLMTNAFSGMEDALVKFATTGKLSFSDLARSIIADMIRIQARAAMSSALSSIFGAFVGSAGGVGSAGNAGYGNYSSAGLASAYGYSSGGYTGTGDKHAPAGIVHKGEVVWSQADVRKAGGVGVVEAMRLGKPGLSNGGIAGPAPAFVRPSGGGGASVVVNIHNNNNSEVKQTSRRSNGMEVIDIFIDKAVAKAAGQLASDTGVMGQAMRTRAKMGI